MNVPLSSVQLQASGVDWLPLALTLVMMALIFLALRLLSALRTQAEKELRRLYQQDVALYLERLEHNRRLKLVSRKSVLLLYRLEGYMKLGNNQMIRQILAQLDQMSLQPRDKLLFLQDRLSFFVSTGEWDEARASRDSLVSFLHKSKADRQAQYQKVIADADQIIGVYVERDTSLIPALRAQAADTADPVQRGVLQYRLAKLYHFAGNVEMRQVYLKRAAKNLQNTYYAVMIKEAQTDPTALERQ